MENTAVNSNMTNRETEAKGLNTEINPLFSILDKSEEFRRLQEGLCGCKGPAGVFGLGEAQRTHIEAALFSKAKRPMLVVVPSEQAAARVHEELCCLSRCGAFSGKGTAAQCPQLCSVTGIDVKTAANGSTADKR